MMVVCTHCQMKKSEQDFYACSKSRCKDCYKKKQVEYYAETKGEPIKKVSKPASAFEALSQETKDQILVDAETMSKLQISKKYNLNYKYVCDWYVLGIVKERQKPVKKVPKSIVAFEALPQEKQGQILTDAKIGTNGKPMSKLQISKKYDVNYKHVCEWYALGIIPP